LTGEVEHLHGLKGFGGHIPMVNRDLWKSPGGRLLRLTLHGAEGCFVSRCSAS
jgi:hypothetical protein